VEKASFIFERRRRSIKEWAVLRMAFLVGLLALLPWADVEEGDKDDFCIVGSGTDVEFTFLLLLGDRIPDCCSGGFIWMILRVRVGGDGRMKGSASGTALSFLLPLKGFRLKDWSLFESRADIVIVLAVAEEEGGPCSAADCRAGGGRLRLDSDDDEAVHGLSCAAISVEAAGVGGRIGEGMTSEVLQLLEENFSARLLWSTLINS
jgi:hypothetical protein